MEDKDAKAVLEAILFISGEPVTLDRLRKTIEVDKYNTERLMRELISDYSSRSTGIIITEIAEGFQMVTNPACAPWVRKLLSTAVPKKLTQSSLETLAIIAYKQPIIKAEVEAVRGVNSDGVIKTLLERRLIKILGRKEVPGRPLMYGTTGEFLQYFGLKNLSELPTLKEFQEVDIPEPPEERPEDAALPAPDEQRGKEWTESGEQAPEQLKSRAENAVYYGTTEEGEDHLQDEQKERPSQSDDKEATPQEEQK